MKQSCMMRDCHELKSNSYTANWNLPHKIYNQLCSLHTGELQRKKWCDRECGGESEQLSPLSIISRNQNYSSVLVLKPLTLKV